MLREAIERLTWYPLADDGTYDVDAPVILEVPAPDAEYLRDLWEQIGRLPDGPDRDAKVNELRTHLDLRATFGGSFIDDRPDERPVTPAYLHVVPPEIEAEATETPEATQPSLLEPETVADRRIGRWRPDQPDSARQAAISVYEVTGEQRLKVLEAFKAAGSHGFTDDELARETGALRARTRRQELIETYGVPIVESGRSRPSDAGNPATVWVLGTRDEIPY